MCTPYYIERYCQSTKRKYSQSKKIKELAEACKVPYRGWLHPISTLGQDRVTCSRLISLKPDHIDYIPISKPVQNFLSNIMGMEAKGSLENYTGYPEAGIFGILYLLQTNRYVCPIFPAIQELVTIILGHKNSALDEVYIPWEMAGLYWRWDESIKRYEFQNFLRSQYIRTAQKCRDRFLLSLLTLHTKKGYVHANIIIYDKKTHTLERFDPYEVFTENVQDERLDLQLQELFIEIDPQFSEYVAPPDISFFEKFGLQLEQKSEHLDPLGYCQPWTFIYAQLRLSYPNIVPECIPQILKQFVRAQNNHLTTFIRNYSHFLMQNSGLVYIEGVYDNFLGQYRDPRVGYIGLCLQRLAQQFAI